MSDYYNDHRDDHYRRDEYSYSISGSTGYADTSTEEPKPKKHNGLKAAIVFLSLLIGIGAGYQLFHLMSTPTMAVQDITETKENRSTKDNTEATPPVTETVTEVKLAA